MTISSDIHLKIGGIIFPDMDQCDFTGPFEALARVPNSSFFTLWKDKNPVRDLAGMRLLADTTFDEAPQLDVLLVPGGYGQEALMNLPSMTTRSSLGVAPNSGSTSIAVQWVVARRPCSRPAAPQSSAPVHTE